ncbi:Hypothetical predicted protein [Mytilus galloprovincialis]|uniref:Reverse transcriptase domain-containing protein n=1 Tax=Mytilus galloprovincialis TaxID=29158 RepID=A0A8B6F9Z1_MYTGA|nr:Hypothetical predicted protein [Mytilus galloprovincialis]
MKLLPTFPNKTKCVDDVLLWADSIEESFFQAVQWLDICGRHGITLNPDKFIFGQDIVEFAGLEVTSNTVRPCMKYLKAILDFPTPRNITDVRSWFGLKHCSCKGSEPFCCNTGWRITLVGSRFTHPAESRYAPVEGEALAVVDALDNFSKLDIHHIDLESDATEIDNSVFISAVSSLDSLAVKSVTWDRVRTATASDDNMNELINLIESGTPEFRHEFPPQLQEFFQFREHLYTIDGVIIYKDRIIIPPSLRDEVLSALHAAHQGVTAMISRAESSVFLARYYLLLFQHKEPDATIVIG